MDLGKILLPDVDGNAAQRIGSLFNVRASMPRPGGVLADAPNFRNSCDIFGSRGAVTLPTDSPALSSSDFGSGLSLLASCAEHHDEDRRTKEATQIDRYAPEAYTSPRITTGSSSGAAASGRRPTTGERHREKKLRDDPMVILHSPHLVQCERCGAKIKLSTKSTYDPFHWQKHRERCLKKSDSVAREKKAKAMTEQRRPAWPAESRILTVPKRRAESPPIPQLTPDESGGEELSSVSGSVVKQEPRTPSPARFTVTVTGHSLPLFTVTGPTDCQMVPEFEDYLVHSKRRALSEFSPLMFEGSRAWTWGLLKQPVLVGEQPEDDFPLYGDVIFEPRDEGPISRLTFPTADAKSPLRASPSFSSSI